MMSAIQNQIQGVRPNNGEAAAADIDEFVNIDENYFQDFKA
jgi:hypothetical protein